MENLRTRMRFLLLDNEQNLKKVPNDREVEILFATI